MQHGSDLTLAVTVIALAGAGFANASGTLTTFLGSGQPPNTGLFRIVLLAFWMPVAVLTVGSGIWGGYRALREGSVRNPYLLIFAVGFTALIKVDGVELGWSYPMLGFTAGVPRFGVGINFVGVAMGAWLLAARRRGDRREAPPGIDTQSTA